MKTIETMYKKILLISSLTLLVTACSSSQKTPEFEDYLATNIRSDGSKEFYYTVTMTNPGSTKSAKGGKNVSGGMRVSGGSASNTHGSGGITIGGGSGGGHRGGQGGRGGGQQPSINQSEKLSEQLEKKLLASGFCRDGWMENERYVQLPNASIRGECNESATDRDRENFPNTADSAS